MSAARSAALWQRWRKPTRGYMYESADRFKVHDKEKGTWHGLGSRFKIRKRALGMV